MWWLLLTAMNDLQSSAHSVYATQAQCIEQIDNSLDRCVAVEISMIELPTVPEVEVTVLPEEQSHFAPQMGPAQ